MSGPRISVLIHTRNEEAGISDCIRSCAWADEVIVADMGSVDDTRRLASELKAKIIDVPLAPCVDLVRNQALAQCAGNWILVVDADERVSPGLASLVQKTIRHAEADAYWVPRRNYLFEAALQHTNWPDNQLRLFRRGCAEWSGVVHQAPWIKGTTSELPADHSAALEHVGGFTDMTVWLQKFARYAALEMERTPRMSDREFLNFLIRRPIADFLLRYFGGGWKDGMPGLIQCVLIALYRVMIALNVYARQRAEYQGKPPAEIRRWTKWEGVRTGIKWLRM